MTVHACVKTGHKNADYLWHNFHLMTDHWSTNKDYFDTRKGKKEVNYDIREIEKRACIHTEQLQNNLLYCYLRGQTSMPRVVASRVYNVLQCKATVNQIL